MKRSALALCGIAVVLGSTSRAQVTQLVSINSSGVQANNDNTDCSISADGRFVAFTSSATNLVGGDTNGNFDVFVRDRQNGTTERVSVSTGGMEGNGGSTSPSISADGRYVAFFSEASNLVPGDTNSAGDIFVRDRQSGTTERVSVATGGAEGNGFSFVSSISADGRYVAFDSGSSNLVPGDTNSRPDIFVRDRQTDTTTRVSVDSSGVQANDYSELPRISADSRYVAFKSNASNLAPGDTNNALDIFVHDRQGATTERVSVDSNGVQANGDSGSYLFVSITANGRFVAFASSATNLVPGDTNGVMDIFVRDRQSSTTERVSVDSAGGQANGDSANPSLSADGRFIAFESGATNLIGGDTNAAFDVFLRDRQMGTTKRVSISTGGAEGIGQSGQGNSISADGRFVAFRSFASLVIGDTNLLDIFVHDSDSSGFSGGCDPGVSGVIPCPCSNQPNGLGRGCDNSAATGGAIISASGIAYLSMDSLVFTTSAEKPTATSIVLQGDAVAANGLVFGQGVRCVGGTLKPLYTKTAVGGSITAPNFGAGDPPVSARSSALGDTIQAGQSRWYLVYYRDPIVLGGCPAASTFNATQTGQVVWSL
jgi:Tol biopolymer transport system component